MHKNYSYYNVHKIVNRMLKKEHHGTTSSLTFHKVLEHRKDIIEKCPLPIGITSEEASETRNKILRKVEYPAQPSPMNMEGSETRNVEGSKIRNSRLLQTVLPIIRPISVYSGGSGEIRTHASEETGLRYNWSTSAIVRSSQIAQKLSHPLN